MSTDNVETNVDFEEIIKENAEIPVAEEGPPRGYSKEEEEGIDGPLIHLTKLAAEKIKEIIAEEKLEPTIPVRVKVMGGGCAGFSYDMALEENGPGVGDRLIVIHDVNVIVDDMSLMYLVGVIIDYRQTLTETGFTFENPNATSTCGCSKSFSV